MNQVNSESGNAASGEISLKDLILKIDIIWKYLLSKWLIIIAMAFLGSILGVTYSLFKKAVYNAELSFALEDTQSSGGLGVAAGLASQFGIDLGGGSVGGAFTSDNLLALMKSRSMIENTLLAPVVIDNKKEQTLAELYISFNDIRKGWQETSSLKNITFLPNISRSTFSLKQDSILGSFYRNIIKSNLIVDKLDKKTSIITVKVTSENELFSKFFTEVLVKNVSDFYIKTKTKKSSDNVNILQKQTDSVRRALDAAIYGVALSTDVNPNANPALQVLRTPAQRRQVDVTANQAILTQLVTNLELSKLALRKETPLIQIIDKPILPLERIKFGRAKGIILGGFLGGFLSVLILSIRKLLSFLVN
jgi:hypothetical protein